MYTILSDSKYGGLGFIIIVVIVHLILIDGFKLFLPLARYVLLSETRVCIINEKNNVIEYFSCLATVVQEVWRRSSFKRLGQRIRFDFKNIFNRLKHVTAHDIRLVRTINDTFFPREKHQNCEQCTQLHKHRR